MRKYGICIICYVWVIPLEILVVLKEPEVRWENMYNPGIEGFASTSFFSPLPWTTYGEENGGLKSTPTPKFLDMVKAYFLYHIGPNFQISLIYASIGCP